MAPCNFKEVMEHLKVIQTQPITSEISLTVVSLQAVAARHGLPEHRLQMGSPWSSEKPAALDLPVTHKELEAFKKDITPAGGQHQQ